MAEREGRVVQTAPLQVLADITSKFKGAKVHPLPGACPQGWKVDDAVTVEINTARNIIAVRHGSGAHWLLAQKTTTPSAPAGQAARKPTGTTGQPAGRATGQPNRAPHQAVAGNGGLAPAMFLNPYAMIPAPPRDLSSPHGWGDAPGPGHDVLLPQHWSGTIPITITTQSPLLLLDQGSKGEAGVVPVRERDGVPVLEWTAVKGMLRSYFEAVTNSRFGVVDSEHAQFIAMRQPASNALNMRVGLVTSLDQDGDGSGKVVVNTLLAPATYPGVPSSAYQGNTTAPPRQPMDPSVWVPRSILGHHSHGEDAEAWIHLQIHQARGRQTAFWYWRASEIAAPGGLSDKAPAPVLGGSSVSPLTSVTVRVAGKLLVGGDSFGRKHDERLFVTKVTGGDPVNFRPTVLGFEPEDGKRWSAVYDSYLRAGQDSDPPYPRGRHNTRQGHEDEGVLKKGQLLFARVEDPHRKPRLTGLFPVMIGRETFPTSPAELLDPGHRPAASVSELSPADRLFGWARSEAGATDRARDIDAYAGHIRGEAITCTRKDAVHRGSTPLWLPPLNSPKPEQYRFRLLDSNDKPIPSGSDKSPDSGYSKSKGRRLGRAQYWPHKGLPSSYWTWPDRPQARVNAAAEVGYEPQALTENGRTRYREFLAPPKTKKNVTKAISGWVVPGTTFTTTLRLENVEHCLLGALLWLLTQEGFSFMLGGGKPLGFGAVAIRADLSTAKLATGDAVRSGFESWGRAAPTATSGQLAQLVETAAATLPQRCRDTMLAMGRGKPDLPVHTPRTSREPQAESYEWFVQNEKPHAGRWSNPAPDAARPGLPCNPA